MTWKQILRLLTRWDPVLHYSTWLRELESAMNDVPTAHRKLDLCQPVRNILTDLRLMLLAADMDIPSSHVDTTRQRYITLCNQLS